MSKKTTVGQISGELVLKIGGEEVALGNIGIPLVAEPVNAHSEKYSPVKIGIRADLKQVREFVESVFESEIADGGESDGS